MATVKQVTAFFIMGNFGLVILNSFYTKARPIRQLKQRAFKNEAEYITSGAYQYISAACPACILQKMLTLNSNIFAFITQTR